MEFLSVSLSQKIPHGQPQYWRINCTLVGREMILILSKVRMVTFVSLWAVSFQTFFWPCNAVVIHFSKWLTLFSKLILEDSGLTGLQNFLFSLSFFFLNSFKEHQLLNAISVMCWEEHRPWNHSTRVEILLWLRLTWVNFSKECELCETQSPHSLLDDFVHGIISHPYKMSSNEKKVCKSAKHLGGVCSNIHQTWFIQAEKSRLCDLVAELSTEAYIVKPSEEYLGQKVLCSLNCSVEPEGPFPHSTVKKSKAYCAHCWGSQGQT